MGIRESALQIISSIRSTDKLRVVTAEDTSRSITMQDLMEDAAGYFSEVASSGDYDDLENRPTISRVGQTGEYNDLLNRPTIPTLEQIYPRGSYYETSDSTFDPNGTWPGTWTSETRLDDAVIEEGKSGIWNYRKWKSGVAECWGTNVASGGYSTWGSVYSKDSPAVDYPTGLFSSEVVPMGYAAGAYPEQTAGGNNVSSLLNLNTDLTVNHPALIAMRGTNSTAAKNFKCVRFAIGLWKAWEQPTTIYRWHRTE